MNLWPVFNHGSLERKITQVNRALAAFKPTNAEFQSAVSATFNTSNSWIAGYGYIDTGEVVFKSGGGMD